MTNPRRLAVIGGSATAAALALILGLRWWLAQGDTGSRPAAAPAGARPAGRTAGPGGVEQVDLARLDGRAQALAAGARDPFRYRPAPPPPKKGNVRPMYGPPDPLPPPPPVPPPPIPLKFVGLVETGKLAGRVAVLSDSRGGIFYGREGDIIDGRYRVLRVAVEQAELAYTDGRGRQALRLSGQ